MEPAQAPGAVSPRLSRRHAAGAETARGLLFTVLGEFVLPYDAVRQASNPDALLLGFLQETYEAAADLAKWDRQALERAAPPNP